MSSLSSLVPASRKRRSSAGPLSASKSKKPRSSAPASVSSSTIDAFFRKRVVSAPRTPASASSSDANGAGSVAATLTCEQQKVLDMVVRDGASVFFTGAAGTGKSMLLRAIITALRRKYKAKPDVVAVTASTGMAASNIGGMTLHAWGAIAPTVHNLDQLVSYVRMCKPALRRWKDTQVLIIDEISMVDARLFDTVAALANRLRSARASFESDLPVFGGLQLVLTGDFFQLPPVPDKHGPPPGFAFEAETWVRAVQRAVFLTEVFRQRSSDFVTILNALRQGSIPPSASAALRALSRPLSQEAGAPEPTELYPLRADVARANRARLAALAGPETVFQARDSGKADGPARQKLLDAMPVSERVVLKRGAQVMLVKNMDREEGGRLVNGCIGTVLGFRRIDDIESEDGMKKGAGPIRNVRLGDDGQALVINAPTADGKENINTGQKTPGKPKAKSDEERYPLVLFETARGREAVLLVRDEFRVEGNDGTLLARRMQVPLTLAWALSIHKAQGQTLQRAKIDLRRAFAQGHAYVALSRAASMDGLQVLGFDPAKVRAHPRVLAWSENVKEGRKASRADTATEVSGCSG